ncbi:YbaN family protein [Corticibacter populi]|nr:YbaN family protein [Corticibacter populi]
MDREHAQPVAQLADVHQQPLPQPLARSRLLRAVWLTVAVLSLGVACVGVVVPGLPSTEFVLLSAWAGARGSSRFHSWLLRHRLFGPMLRNWRDGRKVSRRAKWAASVSMLLCSWLMLWTIPHRVPVWIAIGCMAGVQFWLWRRPEP